MKEQFKHVWRVINTDTYVGKSLRNNLALIKSVMLIISLVTFFMTCINIVAKSWFMGATTAFLMVLACASYIYIVKTGNRDVVSMGLVIATSIMFTYYFIIGGNDGFAVLWILVVPYAIMSIAGMKYGVITCIYYFILLVICCWSPGRAFIQYDYGKEFFMRFPVLYILAVLISFRVNYQLQVFNIKQMLEFDELTHAVAQERERNTKLAMQTIISIGKAVDAKDPYTNQHSARVGEYSKLIAKECGWNEEVQERVYIAGLIHDIGKIGVPDDILNKPDRLTDKEFEMIKRHPEVGYNILKGYDAMTGTGDAILYHHERYDGKGYPAGLSGEDIPVIARIIAVADSFDAMNSNRIYRKARTREYILEQIEEGKGKQFDPQFAQAILFLVEKREIVIDY